MTTVFGLSTWHIGSDMLRSDEGHPGDAPLGSRYSTSECPRCGVILPSSGYCEQCERFVALA